ncbi:endothelin-converting enzyme 2-like, partial [Actinia tenebrosa]|uniref:Endothelin-converting enzyme 2-like n=1 Tax=Actinia tenebrosa TaxID=6105 RepID=A0A6P8IQE4_ACTTE
MADQSFIEKQSDGDGARVVGVSYKIRKIGFPVAVVLCVLLLVVCVVLAVLYSQKVTKTTITSKEPDFEICDEERCFRLGMELVNNMDKKIDPCKDFYAYACQGWENKNPTKNGSIHPISTTPSLGEDDYTTLKKALEIATANYSQNAAVLKTLRFYDSCLNTTAANA